MNNQDIVFVEHPKIHNFVNLTGKTFGKLTVLGYAGKFGNGKKQHSHWWCECSCPEQTIKYIQYSSLKNGVTVSCGCYNREITRLTFKTHGLTKSSEYSSYLMAQNRCNNSNSKDYQWYGGRGIEFRFDSFEEFYQELGEKSEPKSMYSIDRIDVNGHYEKDNVIWLNDCFQNRNKRNNYLISYNGKIKCVAEWAEIFNIKYVTIMTRINIYGWCDICSIIIPANKKGHSKIRCFHMGV